MSPKEIQGFKVIPLTVSKESSSFHELYIKEHSLRHHEEDKPPDRTLFVLNIPPSLTEENIQSLFSSTGKVLNVILESKSTATHNGFRSAHIVYAKREGVLKALQANNLSLDQCPFKAGLDKWIEEYNNSIVDPAKLSQEINSFMLNYDKKEEKSKKLKEIDEGWTVVTKKRRNPAIAHKESVKLKINEKISQANKKKELKNFYTFQIKESKQKQLVLLRKNYEDAKKKVNLMKSSRRFKPY